MAGPRNLSPAFSAFATPPKKWAASRRCFPVFPDPNFASSSLQPLNLPPAPPPIQRFRDASKKVGRVTAVLADLPGPKLRVVLDQPLELAAGAAIYVAMIAGASADIALTEPEVLAKVRVGQRVLFDDGRLQARVA